MRILVAGATGVIGRRLVRHLVDAGHDVTAVVRSPAKAAAVASQGATPMWIDLFDRAAVREGARGKDAIVNLATSIPPLSRTALPWAWRENSRIRREGSATLVQAALDEKVCRFVQESFAPIYAEGGDRWLDEGAAVKPASYNRAVLDAEASVRRFSSAAPVGATGVVLRFGFFYGPDSDFIRSVVSGIRRGIAMALGHPEGYMSTISHDDAASAVAAALDIPSGIYNVVDDEPLTRRALYNAIAQAIGAPPPRFPPTWLWRLFGSLGETLARSQRVSNARFKKASGWVPAFRSAREGLAAMLSPRSQAS